MRLVLGMLLASATLLAGCDRTQALPDLGAATPGTMSKNFDPLAFFQGHVQSWGVMEDRDGAPTGWVVTDCHGSGDGTGRLRMTQHLLFQNDPSQDRTWVMWRTGPHQFEATASDMVGSAKGTSDGRVFHWRWVLGPAAGQRPFAVTMEQWMYQLDDGSVMIRSTISKMGIILAEVSEQFRPVPAA